MNTEDSYEGAVRRLRRLGQAGLDVATPAEREEPSADDRLRDLEELATLASDDNERLTRELESALGEIDRLRRQVATLQEALAGDQPADDLSAQLPRSRRTGLYLFLVAILGVGGAALLALHPWQHAPSPALQTVAAPPAIQPSAPVVPAPPPIAPKIEPITPKAAPITVAPPAVTVPSVIATRPASGKIKPSRHHSSKHHRAKSRHAAHKHSSKGEVPETDDPLGGVNP